MGNRWSKTDGDYQAQRRIREGVEVEDRGEQEKKTGEYFLGKTDEHGVPLRTAEHFHPSVRLRLSENIDPQDPKKWAKYAPKSMRGFTLKKTEDEQGQTRWVYIKQVTIKKVPYTIEIPELQIDSEDKTCHEAVLLEMSTSTTTKQIRSSSCSRGFGKELVGDHWPQHFLRLHFKAEGFIIVLVTEARII